MTAPVPGEIAMPALSAMSRDKANLRLRLRARRDEISPADAAAFALAAAGHAWPLVESAPTVALYHRLGSELDPAPLAERLRQRGARILYPRVSGDGLSFHLTAPGDLVPGPIGLSQPRPNSPIVPTEEIDVLIVPGLAFDRTGVRLGWGRGYYDRALTRAPQPTRIGYGFSCQHIAEVPCGPRDQRMDHLVTELGATPATVPRAH